jgi:hypothetical protein
MDTRTTCAFAAGVALGCAVAYVAVRSLPTLASQPHAEPVQAAHTPPLRPAEAQQPAAATGVSLDDDILGEQLTRNVQFFGRESQQRVCDAFVVVVGLGVRCAVDLVPLA